jgi:hypothetical protein
MPTDSSGIPASSTTDRVDEGTDTARGTSKSTSTATRCASNEERRARWWERVDDRAASDKLHPRSQVSCATHPRQLPSKGFAVTEENLEKQAASSVTVPTPAILGYAERRLALSAERNGLIWLNLSARHRGPPVTTVNEGPSICVS